LAWLRLVLGWSASLGAFHFINNKAIHNVIRDGQLLTSHNLRIQLQEMLHGHDTKFS
jgi:hypothetical protein